MVLGIFEDEAYANFLPLTYTRPVFELRCGASSLGARVARAFSRGGPVFLFTRDYLAPALRKRLPKHLVNQPEMIDEDLLLVNGSLIPDEPLSRAVEQHSSANVVGLQNGRVVFAWLKEADARRLGEAMLKPFDPAPVSSLKRMGEVVQIEGAKLLEYPWELLDHNAVLIHDEFGLFANGESEGTVDGRAVVYGDPKNVFVGRGSFIEAGVVIDARRGPVYIGEEVYVQTPSRIEGPCYVGDESIIFGAQLREGCSIGEVCRVGGELEETIAQGYSNKRHVGFIGHAYIGEWVNLGAGTENSDLKNTYGTVKVNVAGRRVDTQRTFVGCFIGDHAKTGIGTHIFTGKRIGVCSHVMGFLTEDVPSFTMWAKTIGGPAAEIYLDSAIQTEKRVFARRKVQQTKEDVDLLQVLFKLTEEERGRAGVTKERFEL